MRWPILLMLISGMAFLLTLAPALSATGGESPARREYVRKVTTKILRNWNPIRATNDVSIKVRCKIHRDGSVSEVTILQHTDEPANEQRALSAVRNSAPFERPAPSLGDPIELKLTLQCPKSINMTVSQAIQRYGPEARSLLHAQCASAAINYPPKRLVLVALKEERQLLMFGGANKLGLLQSFPLVSYSGALGPKLHEGDLQIPEGLYQITGASGRGMLSLLVDYPNQVDRRNAASDLRTKLGGDILIHGGSVSTGCLVISNEQMQELLIAVCDVGFKNTRLIISPCDLTKHPPKIDMSKQPKWLPVLYSTIKAELSSLPLSPSPQNY